MPTVRPYRPAEATAPAAPRWWPRSRLSRGPAEPAGGLPRLRQQAGIQLRVRDHVRGFCDEVTAGRLGFSGIRLGNAHPRPA